MEVSYEKMHLACETSRLNSRHFLQMQGSEAVFFFKKACELFHCLIILCQLKLCPLLYRLQVNYCINFVIVVFLFPPFCLLLHLLFHDYCWTLPFFAGLTQRLMQRENNCLKNLHIIFVSILYLRKPPNLNYLSKAVIQTLSVLNSKIGIQRLAQSDLYSFVIFYIFYDLTSFYPFDLKTLMSRFQQEPVSLIPRLNVSPITMLFYKIINQTGKRKKGSQKVAISHEKEYLSQSLKHRKYLVVFIVKQWI